jgi:hypothetical protein
MLRLCAFLLWLALVSLMSLVFEGVKVWLLLKPYKRFRNWRAKRRGETVLQGKVTYASIAVLVLSWLAQRLDFPLLPDEIGAVVSAVGVVVGTVGGVYGRYRATKQQ